MRFLLREAQIVVLEHTPGGRLLLVSEAGPRGFETSSVVEAVRQTAHAFPERLFMSWRGHLVARGDSTGPWGIVHNAPRAALLLSRAFQLVCAPPGTQYDTLRPSRNSPPEGGLDEELRSCGLTPFYGLSDVVGRYLLAAADGFPIVEGILSHPVFGEPAGRWLRPGWPSGSGGGLDDLFRAFRLPPVEHAMLYSFLFGCFHAVSLDNPRPLLLVDSQYPGRGKGEIGQVLSVLLDGSQSAIPVLSKGSTDDLVAHLIEGHRVLAAQNVSATANWSKEFVICLATDGSVKKRAKYDRHATAFKGIVGMLSTVYGQASFHEDVITRAWRVYLHGPAQALDPRPCQVVVDRRDDLLREIRDVYSRSQPYTLPPVSRFGAFEAAGASAYAAWTGLPHEKVGELIKAGYLGARGLRNSAIVRVHKLFPEKFGPPVPSRILTCQSKGDDDFTHARCFGQEIQ